MLALLGCLIRLLALTSKALSGHLYCQQVEASNEVLTGVGIEEELITVASDAQRTLQLTIMGGVQNPKTAEDVAKITYNEFAELYAVRLLPDNKHADVSPAMQHHSMICKWS